MPDHIHMLVSIPPKISVSSFMGHLKGKSALMMFDKHANLKYKIWEQALLGGRILCRHGREKCRKDTGIYPQATTGRRNSRPDKHEGVHGPVYG